MEKRLPRACGWNGKALYWKRGILACPAIKTKSFLVCGSVEKKRLLREELEANVERTELNVEAVPDTNVLTCLVKDFLRELPEPLIPTSIYSMLVEAFSVALPNDPQGNRQLLLRVIDCLPTPNKASFCLGIASVRNCCALFCFRLTFLYSRLFATTFSLYLL